MFTICPNLGELSMPAQTIVAEPRCPVCTAPCAECGGPVKSAFRGHQAGVGSIDGPIIGFSPHEVTCDEWHRLL